jgi:Cyclin
MSIPSQDEAILQELPQPPPEGSTKRAVRLTDSRVAVVAVISSLVASRMRAYDLVPAPSGLELTSFHTLKLPNISPVAYISRLACYAECSEVALLAALGIADRAAVADPRLIMTPFCVHRVILTSLVLASKHHDGLSVPLSYYATVGGISVHELLNLEDLLLKAVEWSIDISAKDIEELERDARTEAAQGPAELAANAELRCTDAGLPPLVPLAPVSAVSVSTETAVEPQFEPSESFFPLPES